jgi:uncharacterized protein (DUF1684 family)
MRIRPDLPEKIIGASRLVAVDELDLLDWKRQVFALYAEIRATEPQRAWQRWRETRDVLFRDHPQSPLPEDARSLFAGLRYYPYDPSLRVLADVERQPGETVEITASAASPIPFRRFAVARFELGGAPCSLELYWLDAYGGGVFLPFADETSGRETYGAGRYLLDTVKGADLGDDGRQLVLDFNFAYNPSCAYDPGWACPLAPPPNRLALAVRGGERL